MPLEDSYWEMMKSGVADMVNTGGRAGGSITAALFLKQVRVFTRVETKSTFSIPASLLFSNEELGLMNGCSL